MYIYLLRGMKVCLMYACIKVEIGLHAKLLPKVAIFESSRYFNKILVWIRFNVKNVND